MKDFYIIARPNTADFMQHKYPHQSDNLFAGAVQEYAAIHMPSRHAQTLNAILASTTRAHEEFCSKNLGLEYNDRPVGGNGAPGENGLDEEEQDEI